MNELAVIGFLALISIILVGVTMIIHIKTTDQENFDKLARNMSNERLMNETYIQK